MKFNIFVFCSFFVAILSAQTHEYVYRSSQDSTYNCYLMIMPESGNAKGMIIRDYSSLPDMNKSKKSPYRWMGLALKNDLAVLYTTTSNYFPELYYDESCQKLLDEIIHEVLEKYPIPKNNLFIGGISASGTRALRYTQFCEEGKSRYGIEIKGAFSVDSPLDLERFYYSAKEHKKNFKAGMLWEANLMEKVFPEKFGAGAEKLAEEYRSNSVYAHRDPNGGNTDQFLKVPLLFFHEPDIDWWLEERGATYYDFNSFDIAGMVNDLKIKGHKDVELITTSGKGFNRQGERNCHSWTIVDEDYLIKWITDRLD